MTENETMDLERFPGDGPLDETDVSLRAHILRLSEEKLQEYDPTWSDERFIEWDGNFRDDGALMLVCCERDVEVKEYREVLERYLGHRNGE